MHDTLAKVLGSAEGAAGDARPVCEKGLVVLPLFFTNHHKQGLVLNTTAMDADIFAT